MIPLWVYLAFSGLLLFIGYLVTVYSNAVYIDPEDIRTIFPQLSERRSRRLEQFIADPRAFYQIGLMVRITSSVLLGMMAILMTLHLNRFHLMPEAALFVLIAVILWIHALVFFIYLPRRISIERAREKLIRFLPLMNIIYLLVSPLTGAFSHLAARDTNGNIPEEQKDDILERAIETLAESAGISSPIIEADEKEMIHQIFQLDVTEVEAIMVPRISVTGIDHDADLETIRQVIDQHGFSRYPVCEDTLDNILGVLYVKDLLLLDDDARRNFALRDHIREPLMVSEHKKIDQLLAEFKKAKTHVAIVIDEFGGTSGLVTLEDILEEIVGEIEDEHDPEQARDILPLENGSLEVSGTCPLEDLAEELDIELQQDEFETVGGMIYDMVGSVPTEGTALSWEHTKIKVLEVQGQRIIRVLVTPGNG